VEEEEEENVEYEPLEEEEEDEAAEENLEEEFMDPSNPFYAAKKAQKEQAKGSPAGGAESTASAHFG